MNNVLQVVAWFTNTPAMFLIVLCGGAWLVSEMGKLIVTDYANHPEIFFITGLIWGIACVKIWYDV